MGREAAPRCPPQARFLGGQKTWYTFYEIGDIVKLRSPTMVKIRIAKRPAEEGPQPEVVENGSTDLKACRYWFATWNSEDVDFRAWMERMYEDNRVIYIHGSVERGESGNRHLQFIFYLRDKVTVSALVKHFQRGPHYEPVHDHVAAWRYCSKPETHLEGPWSYGERPHPGQRTDIQEYTRRIKEKKIRTEREAADFNASLYLRSYKGTAALLSLYAEPREFQTKCFFMYGPSGIGKTLGHRYHDIPFADVYKPTAEAASCTYNWFGYTGQPFVMIDEVDWRRLSPTFLLELGNPCPLKVPVKGRDPVDFRSRVVIIVSNDPLPDDEFFHSAPFRRRYTQMYVGSIEDTSRFWEARRADQVAGFPSITPATSGQVSLNDPPLNPPKLVRQEAIVIIDQIDLPPSESV